MIEITEDKREHLFLLSDISFENDEIKILVSEKLDSNIKKLIKLNEDFDKCIEIAEGFTAEDNGGYEEDDVKRNSKKAKIVYNNILKMLCKDSIQKEILEMQLNTIER